MRLKWSAVVTGIVVIVLGWFFRTWFHGLAMLVYAYPVIPLAVAVWLLLHIFILGRSPSLQRRRPIQMTDGKGNKTTSHYSHLWWVSLSLLTVMLIAGVILANWGRVTYLARNLEYRPLAELPASHEKIRLMPPEVAFRYAKDSLQLSQYQLGRESIVKIGEDLSWVYPLTPDGLIITFTRKNKGIMYVNATTQEKNAAMVWQDLATGEGMQLTDNLWWNVYRHRYFVHTEKPFYVTDGQEIYTVVPAISYSYHFGYGVPYSVPHFAGVFLVKADGSIAFLTPQQAAGHPLLSGNRLFPEGLARTYVNAYQYHLGVINKLFLHQDQIQIQDVELEGGEMESEVNKQPFLMHTAEGLKWFISAEPYGESHGIFKIFLVDAVTGNIGLYELPATETLTGPVRAMDYVRRANPVVDWSRFALVEPLPLVREDILYWKVAVIPQDAAGIAYQAFVDSRTNAVLAAETDAEVAAFTRGEALPPLATPTAPGTDAALLQQIQTKLQELEELVNRLEGSTGKN